MKPTLKNKIAEPTVEPLLTADAYQRLKVITSARHQVNQVVRTRNVGAQKRKAG